jgi:choline dehydrogenase-like flavoprotein
MRRNNQFEQIYDVIIIGSGFGGSMIAHKLVNAGLNVLMLERGNWVSRGPHNWAQNASVDLTPFYTMESPYRVRAGGNKKVMGFYSCVGGPSVFYGGVSFRFREKDFQNAPEIVGESNAEWPLTYDELEPYYSEAEHLLNVAGGDGGDPTKPFRSKPYPQSPPSLSDVSQRIQQAGKELGLRPFQLPLAINYSANNERNECVKCTTCDTFACAVNAKNDLATVILPPLLKAGLTVLPNTVTTKLRTQNNRIAGVECFLKTKNTRSTFYGKMVIISTGALGSAHLLLASELNVFNPGGANIGHYLMRHVNAIVFGVFPGKPDKENTFHKQICFQDFYFGHPKVSNPAGKLGNIQQLQTPPVGLVKQELPKPFGNLISPAVQLSTGLLTIVEDQPQFSNHVSIDWNQKDQFGLPQLNISHYYSGRDLAASKELIRLAKQILRKAGAWFFYVHKIKTFSHAVGTVRMGKDPAQSVLDKFCRFRGIDNLYVVDGSFMPTASGVNPSLTIAANALRVGDSIVKNW